MKKFLTIIVPLYNKEKYIAKMLDSIFAQKTKYDYNILIADDHSTDRSLEIVHEYEILHPGVITVLRSDTNQKLYKNIFRAYERISTAYFCVLDPDDFWSDEKHIENALDFLEEHKEFSIYSSGITRLNPNGEKVDIAFARASKVSTFEDYLDGRAVIAFTQSAVYRNIVFTNEVPEKIRNFNSPTKERTFRADSFRNFIHILEGKSYYNPTFEACYRITDEGIWAGSSDAKRNLLNAEIFADFWRYTNRKRLLFRSFRFYIRARAGRSNALAQLKERMKYLQGIYMANFFTISFLCCRAAAIRFIVMPLYMAIISFKRK